MKISHKSKRAAPPHPQIAILIADILATPTEQLPAFLQKIDSWKWPRSDLNSWIRVLNRFDTILEDIIRDHDIDNLQLRVFGEGTKSLIREILRFERLLLENSTNRKMFNSYDRLNSLLFTGDLDILESALLLLLRPSQQYSAQPALSHALHISTARLAALASRPPALREYGIDMLEMVSENGAEKLEALPAEASEVDFTFYRRGEDDKEKKSPEKAPEAPVLESTTTGRSPPIAPPSGPIHVHMGPLVGVPREAMEILAEAINDYSVPDNERFELLSRIRNALALEPSQDDDRDSLVTVRLLSIAVYAHTHTEAVTQSSLFLFEPDLVNRIAELLQLDRGIPMSVQAAAIAALDALARYRGKIQEVLTSVNAGVNHGILMSLLRKTVADLASPLSAVTNMFVDALLSFVIYIASHAAGGNMVVGAGLVPLLIQIIENKLPQRLPVVSKAMQLVDNVLYGFTNAFQIFCNGRGVEVLAERIQYEVQLAIISHEDDEQCFSPLGAYGLLAFPRTGVLKHTLRSMHRMMQSSGTAEGLRGLIDSTLLKSVKLIIQHRGLFGPTVLPIAINIMATFVHNEPTSLAVIQEAGLPESLYKAIETGLEASIEVIQAIPNAIGALCLNQTGQDQLACRPSIIPTLFSIFTSDRHLKVLQEKENAAMIGGTMDELIRHHPSLKPAVFEALKSTLSKIEDLGRDYVPPSDIQHWYQLVASPPSGPADEDVVMEDVAEVPPMHEATVAAMPREGPSVIGEEPSLKPHDNIIVAFIDALGKFLEGFFQHLGHCKDFITTTDGLDRLSRLLSLPCMPYDFANSIHSDSLVQIIRTMTEVSPAETIGHLAKQVKRSLEDTDDFWKTFGADSQLLSFVDIQDSQKLCEANDLFRRLVTLHIRVTLLSDIYASAGYTHGRGAVGLLPLLTGPGSADIIPDLGALHRACIWENILFKTGLAAKGVSAASESSIGTPNQSHVTLNGHTPDTVSQQSAQPLATAPDKLMSAKADGPSEHNGQALKHLASQIPSSLAPLFQAVARMFMYGRRNPDLVQKKHAAMTSAAVANVMLLHLKQPTPGNPLSGYAYHTIMLGMVTVLLFDERTTQNSLHAMLLLNLRNVRGIEAIVDISRRFAEAIGRITAVSSPERTENDEQQLVHLYGGLKVALHLLHSLVSFKPAPDASQNTLLTAQDKPETDPDYYESHDFLVKMRLAILPFIRDLWQAAWLISAPPAIGKYVAQSVLEIVSGEKDELGGDTTAEVNPPIAHGLLRPSGPDEDRIRQLTDMGFPRAAAVRALTRSHNNVSVATEFLLSHPFLDTTGDAEAQDDGGDEAGTTSAIVDNPVDTPQVESVVANTDGSSSASAQEAPETVSEGTSEERRKALAIARESLTVEIGLLALRLVDAHPSLIFDVRKAFTGSPEGYVAQALRKIVDDIRSFLPSAYGSHEEQLAIRCRLLALVLSDSPTSVLQVTNNEEENLMDLLVNLLLINPVGTDTDHPAIPKWLPCLLLAAESLLVLAETPRGITLPLASEPIKSEVLLSGPVYSEARSLLFDIALRLLKIPSLPRDELLATLRLLVLLTRDHDMTNEFVRRGGIPLLLQRLQASSAETTLTGCQSYIAILLRRVMEDKANLEQIMNQEVKRWFAHPRTRVVDVTNYVRNCTPMAARDPQMFIQVTQSLCQLLHPDSVVNHIVLKSSAAPAEGVSGEGSDAVNTERGNQMLVDRPPVLSAASPDDIENVVHFMVSELMRVGKIASAKIGDASGGSITNKSTPHPPSSLFDAATPAPSSSSKPAESSEEVPEENSSFFYACFLMQCLTELLFSYDACKSAFLSYSKKRTQTPVKDATPRHKATTALNFLLSELVSFGAFNVEPKFDAQKRMMLCNWAMSIIVALCIDCSSSRESKDGPTELASIRKTVLDAVSRSIKDAPPAETDDARYGRILALAELCHRLLTVRFNIAGNKPQEETPVHIAKIMLEKHFVATLTNILSDIDLNYPNMRSLVIAILRPLEHLTKIAIKMGRSADKGKDAPGDESDGSVSEGEPGEAMDTIPGRGETPDLYRNSSLGMYGGEMEDANYVEAEEMLQAADEEDEEAEMEYDEETGSEDTSNTEEEGEGEGEGELENGEDDNGEVWTEDDEDMEDEGSDEEESGDEGEDEDSLGENGIMWEEGSGAEVHVQDGMGDDADEEAELDEMPTVIDDDDGDEEGDERSEEEDVPVELGVLEEAEEAQSEDIFGIGQQLFRGAGARDERLIFTNGATTNRARGSEVDGGMQFFGRPRQITTTAQEPMAHPLLIDTAGSALSPAGHSRALYRRSQRNLVSTNAYYGELLNSIEEIVGGGAMHIYQQMIPRPRGLVGADIRVEVTGQGIIAGSERHIHRHGRTPISAVVRDPRGNDGRTEGQDFSPLPTLQRWTEEAKISNGKFLQERLGRLCNHVTLSLLPHAREAAAKAKEKEKERAEREATAAKQAAEMAATPASESAGVEVSRDHVENQDFIGVDSNIVPDVVEATQPESQTVDVDEDQVMADVEPPVEDGDVTPQSPVEPTDFATTALQHEEPSSGPSERSAEGTTVTSEPATQTSGIDETGASSAPARVTVMIHGNEVDITDTGIDHTFLEALPDDMREEVLNQHFRERRTARIEQPPESQISPEFLDALPPEIRAEILAQERLERRRREPPQTEGAPANAGGVTSTGPVEIDPATFIASLDPQLRQVVLLDSDDVFLQSLPSHMIAEAGVYRDTSNHIHHVRREAVPPTASVQPAKKTPSPRDAILLLDRSSIATLVRLLFFPQLLRKNVLHKVLLNLCENAKSRTDLFNLLLSILQDGTGDLGIVDRSFAQMSVRSSKPSVQTPAKLAGKKTSTDYVVSQTPAHLPHGIPPDLIAQQCLNALSYIVNANELSSLFFLTEHELPAGLRRSASKKGKGKEKQAAQSHYPIVLLLNLLDRQILLKTPSIMDSVANLLAAITRPLVSLKDSKKQPDDTTAPGPTLDAVPHDSHASAAPSEPMGASGDAFSGNTGAVTVSAAAEQVQEPATSVEAMEEKILLANPPQIPHPALRLIVNILTVGECSGRTFQHTLALIQHLFCIQDAREVIANELKVKAQEFGQTLFNDLGDLVVALRDEAAIDLPASCSAKFSPASSDQAKLLRVLKTIDYMFTTPTKNRVPAPSSSSPDISEEDSVHAIYEAFRFTPLWQRLGDCLAVVEQKPDVEHIATILLPLIESLMVVCKYVGAKSTTANRSLRISAPPMSPTTSRESMEDLFTSFTDVHRKVLNLMVRNNPSLMSGSFSLLIHNPRVLDFDNKRNYFNQQLRRRPQPREHHGTLQLNVRRARVFEDSFQYLQRKTGDQIKYGKLSVRFYEEEGVDAGGVTREWFQILARQMFNPNYALFEPCAADKQTYQPNRASAVNSEHLSFFKFVGRVIGKAIYDGRLLDAHFARSLYRQLLGKRVDYKDVEWVDPEYYNSLCWILDNDPTVLDLTFIAEVDEFGKRDIIALKEGGASIPVTEETKKEYVQLSAQYRLYSSIKDQIESLLAGFYEIVPKELISIFNEQEVELLISGTPDIDVDEWRAATEYNGYTSSDPVIVWWWRALKSFNRDERAKVLSFATGTSRVPLGGFVELQGVQGVQRFSIHRAYGDSDRLPQAHTCFNQIDLPQYSSYEMLRQQLLLAINEGGEGFGFA